MEFVCYGMFDGCHLCLRGACVSILYSLLLTIGFDINDAALSHEHMPSHYISVGAAKSFCRYRTIVSLYTHNSLVQALNTD